MRRRPDDRSLAQWIRELERDGEMLKFYETREWRELRDEVLREAHWGCQDCLAKSPAVHTRATVVHHVNEVRDRPDMALTWRYTDAAGVERDNLVALCHDCHERRHGRAFVGQGPRGRRREQVTEERFD